MMHIQQGHRQPRSHSSSGSSARGSVGHGGTTVARIPEEDEESTSAKCWDTDGRTDCRMDGRTGNINTKSRTIF
jgi:hypothetical protein